MQYQFIKAIKSKTTVYKYLKTEERDNIIMSLIGAVKGIDDGVWLQNKCLDYINNDDYWIAKTALNCLSDIIRKFKNIDLNIILLKLENNINSDLRGEVENLKDDIAVLFRHPVIRSLQLRIKY